MGWCGMPLKQQDFLTKAEASASRLIIEIQDHSDVWSLDELRNLADIVDEISDFIQAAIDARTDMEPS